MDERCERCGGDASVDNVGQHFCTACWEAIRDSWGCCLDCGMVFETDAEHSRHVAQHHLYPVAGELHHSRRRSATVTPQGGMSEEARSGLRLELDQVRVAWSDWLESWEYFRRQLSYAGYPMARIEAYQPGMGSDEGGGQSMEGWLDEIEADLAGEGEK